MQLGTAQQLTVQKISANDVKAVEKKVDDERKELDLIWAREGDTFKKEAQFYQRNRALIASIKETSDYTCKLCGFNFELAYGEIGHKYIVAHHLRLLASGPTTTKIEDIVLVCANCHAMIHKENPPIEIEKIRSIIVSKQRHAG